MKRVLLTGMSGVGKSAVLGRLSLEGFLCVDLDDGWMRDVDGEPMIDLRKVRSFMQAHPNDPIVFAGCAMNQRELGVDCTVLLTAPAQVMRERIAQRENPFGKDDATWEKILADKAEFEPMLRAVCDVVIDTQQPLEETVAQIKALLKQGGHHAQTIDF